MTEVLRRRPGAQLVAAARQTNHLHPHGCAAQVRAKAVKCIGGAAEVDARVLGMHEVQLGVATALQVRAPGAIGGLQAVVRRTT